VLAPLAVVAVVAAGALIAPRLGGGPVTVSAADQALLDRPTGGDLAGDTAVLEQATSAFVAGVRPADSAAASLPTPPPGIRTSGDPRVLWVGTTPTGPAAIVAQVETGGDRSVLAVGYLGTSAGRLALAAVTRDAPGYEQFAGALVGADRRVLLVLDRGETVYWSYSHRFTAAGGIQLVDRPVRFSGGAAAIPLPASVDPAQVRLTVPGPPAPNRVLPLGNADEQQAPVENRLRWAAADPDDALFPVGTGDRDWGQAGPGGRYDQLASVFRPAINALLSDLAPYGSAGDDLWYVYGGLPDGTRLVGTDLTTGTGDPSRAYLVLVPSGGQTTVLSAPVEARAAVPVRMRLPGGQGLLVAAKGRTFTWTGGGTAHTAQNAALVPAGVTDLRADGTPVPLS
jgi:hypothetical protein